MIRLAHVLIGLNLASAAVLSWLMLAPVEIGVLEPRTPPAAEAPVHPADRFADLPPPARPLFARIEVAAAPAPPPRAVSPVPPPPPPREPELRLVGVIAAETGRVAFIAVEGQAELKRVTPGAEVEGWRVGLVGLRAVEIEKAGRKMRLVLDPPKAP